MGALALSNVKETVYAIGGGLMSSGLKPRRAWWLPVWEMHLSVSLPGVFLSYAYQSPAL